MQHRQTSQGKSPTIFNAAAQGSPLRRKPVRMLRSIKADFQQVTALPQRVLADGNIARGGETGFGAFYEAQEEAARRIAHRLHDESAQMLATIYLQLAAIARDCPDSTVRKIDVVVKQLDGVREQLRGLSHELSPPILDQLGLLPALQSLANGVRARSGLTTVVSGPDAGLPRLVGAVLYRVVQEALSNVVRHAQATEAAVRLSIEGNRVFCTVSDNGIGFQATDQDRETVMGMIHRPGIGSVMGPAIGPVFGLGLAGIHDRVSALNGRFRIASRASGGTELQVEIPL